ncbi:alpha/beta hydrolase [Phytohabitans flavus]|uniref:Alpha/beta hydrolase n=1 Tax=Phytohabitans flavus TaxID=1076124 RepID=A0A6F8XLL8_9ACTN|nr:alpha/beta hydrolase [Phytohabitans flavus]BCB74712.1 alpha/beta hydrolase [Phytohabitans flavus]
MSGNGKPTVVLVHGAFADTSSWSGVISELRRNGITARAFPNGLRTGQVDGAHLADYIGSIDGPVLLVGHSYGGIVITEAATRSDKVTGLVYVAAFALEENETPLGYLGQFPANELGTALVDQHFTTPEGADEVELYLATDKFRKIFAADLPAEVTDVQAVSQRPILAKAFGTPAGKAAWTSTPSWYLVAEQDEAIHPDAQRAMAERSGSSTVNVPASHSVAGSQPAVVANLIINAIKQLEEK